MRINEKRSISKYKMRKCASGVCFFNRETGINVLLDEVRIPEREYSPAPRNVSIALTNRCDLNCPFCFVPKDTFTLDFDQLKGWLIELDENGTLGVGFGGGEPTLHPEFTEICRFAAEQTALAVSFTTHGHSLDKKNLNALKRCVNFIRISMDGIGTTYEQLRNRSFHDLLKRLADIRESGIRFGINYILNAKTFPCLDEATKIAESAGATEFLLLPEMPVCGSVGCTGDILKQLRDWVSGNRGTLRLSISEFSSDGFPVCNPFLNETGLRAFAHIDAAGNLKRTSFNEFGTSIGDGVMVALGKLMLEQETT